MDPTLELSHRKAYVNVKWKENAAAGEPASILIYQLANFDNKLLNKSITS